jgi:Ca-activated chloride channel family protein
MPGEVTLTHQVGKEFMPVTGGSQVAYVLIEAKPTEMMAQVRMPLNFALVLDHSGSMKGPKLKNVKEAVKMVIDRLEPTDYVSVVIFDDTIHTVIESMPVIDKPGMKAAIDQIRDGGGTTMSLGMIQGLNELRRYNIPNAVERMILLTDGVTYGDTDRCKQLARDAAAAGIAIYPLGIGADWDEDLLDQIGQLSGGMPAEFIRNPADALSIFEQQIQSAVDVAVRNATLTLRLPMGVSPKKAVKVLPIISDLGQSVLSDRQIIVPLGDLEKDKPQSVLVELLIDPRQAGLFRIAQAELSYDIPVTGVTGEKVRDDIKVTFTPDPNQAAAVNPYVMNFAEKANAHRLVTRVLDEYKRTGKATTRLAPNVTRVLDDETVQALEQINQGQQISQEQVKSIGNKTRKLTQRLDDLLP